MGHSVKRGDTPTLKWDLGRDLTGVAEARVLISAVVGSTPIVNRVGTVVPPAADGIVSLEILATDYGPGKLEADGTSPRRFHVEVQTTDGAAAVLTHPSNGYEVLTVVPDLGP